MVDLVGIGVSGLSAYQQALATTSNNIANMQTDGYVRQRVSLQPAGQDNLSRISLGNGVRFAGIERLYDQFAEENLQRATSDLKGQETLLNQLQSLQDAIGSSDSGLHGALQQFFDSARALEAAPAAAGSRAGFLTAAEGVTARIRNLGSTVQALENSSRVQIEQDVAALNSYLQEIGTLNKELLKRSDAAEQPMQLLDRRDATLKKISALMGVTVKLSSGGAASIYAGDSAAGAALVENANARSISAQFDKADYGRVQFVLDAASRPTVLPTVRNGSLGGLVTFRSQSLGVAADTLDALALGFGRGVNQIHRDGLDAQGDPGGDLFYVGPRFVVDGQANAGGGRLGVEVIDPNTVQPHSFKMTFDAKAGVWTVTDQTSGETAKGASELALSGLKFSIQGQPKDGDTFIVNPESRPALAFQTLIRDPEKVATANKATVSSSPSNKSTAAGGIVFGPPRPAELVRSLSETLPRSSGPPYVDTFFSKSSRPIAMIPAGMGGVKMSVSPSDGELAVFTRDGRQISGPDMTGLKDRLLKPENGFYAGASYSNSYLNKTGAAAYLDHDFVSGAYAESGSQLRSDGSQTLTAAMLTADPIDLSTLPTTFNVRINQTQSVAIDLSANVGDVLSSIKSQINLATRGSGNHVEADIKEVSPGDKRLVFKSVQTAESTLAADSNSYVVIDGTNISGVTQDELADNINAAGLGVRATRSTVTSKSWAAGSTVVIDGRTFSGSTVNTLVSNINAAIPSVGVVAAASSGKVLLTANGVATIGGSLFDSETTIANKLQLTSSRPVNLGGPHFDSATYFNDSPLSIETDESSVLTSLGLRRGFAMTDPLGEDLLVFGVQSGVGGANADFSSVSMAATYATAAKPSDEFGVGKNPNYKIEFSDSNTYRIVDLTSDTEVSTGTLDPEKRSVAYRNWSVTFDDLPQKGDVFSVSKTDAPLGDNRVAAAIARLQSSRSLLGNDQTLQENYESLVNKTGALTVQAEIGKNAQQVVFDHATSARERVSGVNLDEELADLLRYQQAYQANAQVVQVASRLFDALMQKL